MPVSTRTLPIFVLLLVFSRPRSALSPDGLSLLAFKFAITSDPSSALADWDPGDADPCRWSGVSCAKISGFSTPRVVSITVSGRNLSGYIPSELGALAFLRRLNLHGNLLSGSVPSRLSDASSLHSIFLYSNKLTGQLPPDLCDLPRLQNLDLSHNYLSGEIPTGIRYCRPLQRLVLRNNRFSGVVPTGVWPELKSLMELDLSSNDFSGPIPPDLGEMNSMTGAMNLSRNRLSGNIPAALGKLPIGVSLDFRSNELSGEIPRNGALENQGIISFLENPDLCGVPLPVTCKEPAATSSTRNQRVGGGGGAGRSTNSKKNSGKRKGLSTKLVVVISAVDAIGIALIGLILVHIFWKVKDEGDARRCTERSVGDDSGGERSVRSLLCLSSRRSSRDHAVPASSEGGEEERRAPADGGRLVAMDKGLEVEMEELLGASAYVLGSRGSGGIVYRVVLRDGAAVAVRRLGEGGVAARGGKCKEFATEAQAIARVRHPNLVSLRAYYWSHEAKFIVSDYVANGNLASALRGGRSGRRPHVSWATRLRIAGGAARGVAHLHECSPRKFVHGNIKPSNILLDHDFHPRISDFGLARLLTVAGDASLDVMGGSLPYGRCGPIHRPNNYHAPEARLPVGRPTQKWDVYSFGVILLEMVTGRSPEFSAPSSPMEAGELVRWTRKRVEGDWMPAEIVDGGILRECGHAKEDVAAVVQIALACTETDPESRPKMKAVCSELEKIGRC